MELVQYVVLVNQEDKEIGKMEKMEAHQKGLLHRAFSVFVFNDQNELMIHQRALSKYHSAGLWTNTCCSHQKVGESSINAAHRRLIEEMGFDCKLEKAFEFTYRAELENGLIENEYDHVFIGKYNQLPNINSDEVNDWKWISIENLNLELQSNPNLYTEWFKLSWKKVCEKRLELSF